MIRIKIEPYDLQNKLKWFIFTHFQTFPKFSKTGQKFQSRDKIPKAESTVRKPQLHAHCSSLAVLDWQATKNNSSNTLL